MNHTLHWRGICVFVRCEEAKRIALYRRNAGSNGIARQFHKQKSFHKRRTHRIKRVRQRAHDHTFVLCFRQGTLCTSYMYIVQPHVINAFFLCVRCCSSSFSSMFSELQWCTHCHCVACCCCCFYEQPFYLFHLTNVNCIQF